MSNEGNIFAYFFSHTLECGQYASQPANDVSHANSKSLTLLSTILVSICRERRTENKDISVL